MHAGARKCVANSDWLTDRLTDEAHNPQTIHTHAGARKCVIATNIAEASLTIDGIVCVVAYEEGWRGERVCCCCFLGGGIHHPV